MDPDTPSVTPMDLMGDFKDLQFDQGTNMPQSEPSVISSREPGILSPLPDARDSITDRMAAAAPLETRLVFVYLKNQLCQNILHLMSIFRSRF